MSNGLNNTGIQIVDGSGNNAKQQRQKLKPYPPYAPGYIPIIPRQHSSDVPPELSQDLQNVINQYLKTNMYHQKYRTRVTNAITDFIIHFGRAMNPSRPDSRLPQVGDNYFLQDFITRLIMKLNVHFKCCMCTSPFVVPMSCMITNTASASCCAALIPSTIMFTIFAIIYENDIESYHTEEDQQRAYESARRQVKYDHGIDVAQFMPNGVYPGKDVMRRMYAGNNSVYTRPTGMNSTARVITIGKGYNNGVKTTEMERLGGKAKKTTRKRKPNKKTRRRKPKKKRRKSRRR